MSDENARSDEIAREITRRLPDDARPMVSELIAAVQMETAKEAAAIIRATLREELDALRAEVSAQVSADDQRLKERNELRDRYLQEVIAEMQRLSINGKAPTKWRWDEERAERFSRADRVVMELGSWTKLAHSAGLKAPQSK